MQTVSLSPARAGVLMGEAFHPDLVPLVQRLESLHDGDKRTPELEPVMCPAKVWTVGYGHVLLHPQTGRQLRDEADRAQAMAVYRRRWPLGLDRAGAEALLVEDLASAAALVDRVVKVPLAPHQRAALISFAFNVGPGKKDVKDGLVELKAGGPSTLLRRLNGGDMAAAAVAFEAWIYGSGKVLPGLVTRRKAERLLFEGGDWRDAFAPVRMAQAVEPAPAPKPLTQSVTMRAGAGGLGTAAVVAAIGEARELSDAVRGAVETLPAGGLGWVAAAVLAVAVGVMLWRHVDGARQAQATP